MKTIRLVFFGTSSFAVPVLERLVDDKRFDVVTVVTQPDRPVGRHAEVTKSPVKLAAEKLGLPVKQYKKVKSDEAFADLQTVGADVGVVASFGQIIPERVLNLPRLGMVNVHASLLPKYRGASPIQAAIRNGDDLTGVTIMKMDALLDHGPILSTATEPIRPDDTGGGLHDRLSELGAKILPEVLFAYANGRIKPQAQDDAAATTVKLLSREDGLVDWAKPADEIERTVRAYDPWPGTYAMVDDKRLKILSVVIGPATDRAPASRVIVDGRPAVACAGGSSLILTRLQPEGKAAMDGKDFLRGNDWS